MKKKNQKSRSNKYWLLGTSLVCVLLMIFSVFAEKVEGPFRGVADITVIPMQKGISQIGTWIGDVSENFETLKQLKKENKKLQKQVDQLTTENSNLQEEKYRTGPSSGSVQAGSDLHRISESGSPCDREGLWKLV